jgi:hypothetical protein
VIQQPHVEEKMLSRLRLVETSLACGTVIALFVPVAAQDAADRWNEVALAMTSTAARS